MLALVGLLARGAKIRIIPSSFYFPLVSLLLSVETIPLLPVFLPGRALLFLLRCGMQVHGWTRLKPMGAFLRVGRDSDGIRRFLT